MAINKVFENGKYKYEVFVKTRDKSGKQVARRRRWFASEREARKVEHEILNELEGHRNKVTWESWCDHALEKYRLEYRNSTYLNYKNCMNKWFTPIWKGRFIEDIRQSEVHEIIYVSCAHLSSQTKRGLLKVVKRFFNLAIEEGVLVRNPAVGIRIHCTEANQAVLNRNEVEILLKQAKIQDHRFFEHWTLALLTGMRSGELYSLKWTDVDLITGKISVSRAWTRKNGEGPTKTAKSRVIPISKECRKFLDRLKLNSVGRDQVLPRLWEWDQGLQAEVLRHFCSEIGITQIKFHDLRATFITQMLNNGVPLAKVMAIVGHSSLKTTQGYLRLSGKDVEGATEDLRISVPDDERLTDNVRSLFKN